jgi:glycosyltransferase involved in cell wall biosynthesis
LNEERFIVTGDGIDPQPVRPSAFTRKYESLFAGRFVESKGIMLLPAIWRRVVNRFPGAQMMLVGGKGNGDLAKRFERSLEDLGVKSSVHVLGYIPDDELNVLFNESKVFVLPSRNEASSSATAQAMAHGCACVVSDLQTIRSVFGEHAIYVASNDDEGFANAIIDLLKNDQKLEEYSLNGYSFAKTFDWNRIAMMELRAYHDIILGRRQLPSKG